MQPSDTNSALLSVGFDWSLSALTKKITRNQEAFLYDTRRFAQGSNVEANYPYAVIDTKRRVRGAGRVMKIRYESSTGKDFILLGYSILGVTRNESEGSK